MASVEDLKLIKSIPELRAEREALARIYRQIRQQAPKKARILFAAAREASKAIDRMADK